MKKSRLYDPIKYNTAANHLRTMAEHLKKANDNRFVELEDIVKEYVSLSAGKRQSTISIDAPHANGVECK